MGITCCFVFMQTRSIKEEGIYENGSAAKSVCKNSVYRIVILL